MLLEELAEAWLFAVRSRWASGARSAAPPQERLFI